MKPDENLYFRVPMMSFIEKSLKVSITTFLYWSLIMAENEGMFQMSNGSGGAVGFKRNSADWEQGLRKNSKQFTISVHLRLSFAGARISFLKRAE